VQGLLAPGQTLLGTGGVVAAMVLTHPVMDPATVVGTTHAWVVGS